METIQQKKERIIKAVSSKGKIFTVKFIKKDGKERVMNCRKGVVKHLTNPSGSKDYKPAPPHLVTVWDLQVKGYRKINLNTLLQVRGNGQVINF